MITPPTQYFEVVAAAIPTLVVAIVFSARQGEIIARHSDLANNPVELRKRMRVVMTACVFVVAGEIAALIAVVRDSGNIIATVLSFIALIFLLLLIIMNLLDPFMKNMTDSQIGAVVGKMLFWMSLGVIGFIAALFV